MKTKTASHATELPAGDIDQSREQWIQFFPAGVFKGVDGRGPYVIQNPEQFIAETWKRNRNREIPIDYDHQMFGNPAGRRAPAAGWLSKLEPRADGMWGLVQWTGKAAQETNDRQYRYISPTFVHASDGNILYLAGAGLVNRPNLEMTALSSQQGDPADYADEGSKFSPEEMQAFIVSLAKLLGAKEGAGLQELLKATTEKLGRDAKASAHVSIDHLAAVTAELQGVRLEHARQEADAKVTSAMQSGKLPPSMREWAMTLCSAAPEMFDAFIARMPPIVTPGRLNLSSASSHISIGLNEGEVAVCQTLGITTEDFSRARNSMKGQ